MEEISGDNTHKKHRRTAKLPAFYLVWLLLSLGGTKFHLFPEERPGVSLDVRLADGVPPRSGQGSAKVGTCWMGQGVRREGGREGSGFPNEIPAPVKRERPGLRPVAQPVIPAGNINIYFQSAKE